MKAILRVNKIKGAGSITGKSLHNYRLGEVPNADPERAHLNHEYVNTHQHLAPAIETRLQEAGITKTRQDAVKGMEFILTASPERFKRDEAGQVTQDMAGGKWVAENLRFMQQKYGPNLVAFTLHQDEKTPHIHAVVVPITADGRLCAKELFNPQTLRRLQTDYGEAMKPFGLERGTEGSRARHVSMKQIYGMQQAERQSIERDIKPDSSVKQPLTIDKPGLLDLANLERWKQEQEEKINWEYARRLAQMEKAAAKARNAAIANATAKSERKILQQRLNASESLKQKNHQELEATIGEFTKLRTTLDAVITLAHRKELEPDRIEKAANTIKARVAPQMQKDVMEVLRQPTKSTKEVVQRLEQKGYRFIDRQGDGSPRYLEDTNTYVRLDLREVRFEEKTFNEAVKLSLEQTQKLEQQQQQKRSRGMRM